MGELFWSTLDIQVRLDNISTTLYSTVAITTTWASSVSGTLSTEVVVSLGLIIFAVGLCANAVVLAVLVRARRHASTSVHTLIENQSAMDLYTCVFGLITIIMMFKHGYKYNGNRFVDGAICMLFEDNALIMPYRLWSTEG